MLTLTDTPTILPIMFAGTTAYNQHSSSASGGTKYLNLWSMRARPAVTQRDMECDADTVVLMDHFNTSTMQRERERERERDLWTDQI